MKRFSSVTVAWISGFALGFALWLTDELITLLRYCPGCRYQIPILGPLDPYDAEALVWIAALISFLLCGWAVYLRVKETSTV